MCVSLCKLFESDLKVHRENTFTSRHIFPPLNQINISAGMICGQGQNCELLRTIKMMYVWGKNPTSLIS